MLMIVNTLLVAAPDAQAAKHRTPRKPAL